MISPISSWVRVSFSGDCGSRLSLSYDNNSLAIFPPSTDQKFFGSCVLWEVKAEEKVGRNVITTDQLRTYLNVIEDAFGGDADYAQLHKIYSAARDTETRYSPARCIGCEMKEVSGRPDPKHVSTSFVERQNWTVRGTMRRYTRLSNGFSRKLENHAAATALNYFAYNFIKIHRTLRMSPAMAAGVTDRLWSIEDLVALWEAYEQRRADRAA